MKNGVCLDRFEPRDYQLKLLDAIENKGYKRVLAIWPRRAGKDIVAFNVAVRACLRKTCTVFYVLPTFSSARRIVWDNITMAGSKLMDFIPPEVIEKTNSQEMKVTFINGSILQLLGSDTYDNSLVGTNPSGIVFSEYALQDPRAYLFSRPILTANDGWALFVSTPRGKNHLFELLQIAKDNPSKFFVSLLTVDDTKHISAEALEHERKELSEDLIRQEYWCDFSLGVEGSYYSKYIDKMRLDGRIGPVLHDVNNKVHTAWDLGYSDSTCIIFYQIVGQNVRVIDFYQNSKQGLEHYIEKLNEYARTKGYVYGKAIAPHDIRQHEFSSGDTRWNKAHSLGVTFTVCDNIAIIDGIECVRSALGSKVWIDERCKDLINALENYRQEFDEKNKTYKPRPIHNHWSHACFEGETLITTDCGQVPIKDIKIGMRVRTPFGYRMVLKTHQRETKDLVKIKVGNSELITTSSHDIFTQKEMVKADALRYTDILEYDGFIQRYLWQKIYTSYLKESDLRGFKKIFLSLTTKHKSSLMDTFIVGMGNIIDPASLGWVHTQTCIEIYGNTIREVFRKTVTSITSMAMGKTTPSKIWNVSTNSCMVDGMQHNPILGRSLKNVKMACGLMAERQQSGTEVPRVKIGTKNTPKAVFRVLGELGIQRNVPFVEKGLRERLFGQSSVLMHAKQKIGLFIRKILFGVLAVCVRLHSFVINTLLKKHVVKSVKLFQCEQPLRVHDLTIEGDNCYYANGYLVSNSDAFRYLCVSLPKTRDGMSAEDASKIYANALRGGSAKLPGIFSDGGF